MDLNTLKIFGIILALLLAFDLPMLLYINRNMYQTNLKNVNRGDLKFNIQQILATIVCYWLMGGALYYFSVKENSTLNAFILGLVVYGIYNTTNVATLNKFSATVGAIDTAWGTALFTLVAFIVITFFNNNNTVETEE
jgi:uncharacterized membrane protein